MRARSATTALVLAGGLALSACSSSDDTSASPAPAPSSAAVPSAAATSTVGAPSSTPSATTPAPPPVTTGSTSATPVKPAASGCAPTGGGAPATASTREVIDVDGDGRRDTGWLDRGTTLGITTASGATFSLPVDLAGGGSRSALVADPDGRGSTIAALVSDGRTVELFVVRNCGLFPAHNAQGETYRFDLGLRGNGTGVGCSQVQGSSGRTLVGLNQRLDDSGQSVDVTRTQVLIEGTSARNGASDTVAALPGSGAADTASGVTCGDLSMATDGIRERG